MNKSTVRLDGVTISRFVAAFYVFIFHANLRAPIDLGRYFNGVVSNGAIGMSLFFVLSGFVLTYNYDSGVTKDYLIKRIKRIYPAYIFTGLITLPLLFLVDGHFVVGKIIASIVLYVFSIQAWFYQAFNVWNFGGTWSVSVEMFFYIMFPTLLILLRRNNTINILLLSYLATSIIIPVSELMGGHLLFPVYYSNPIYRFPEFIFGMACAKLMLDGFRINFYFFVGAVSILLLVVSFRNPGFMLYNFLVVPIIGIILMWLSQQQIKKNLITTSLIYLGEISYSFYLMQIAVLVIFDHFSPIFKNYDGLYIWVSMFLITLGSSHLCYKYIEKNRTMHNLIDIIAQRVGKVFDFKQA